ncbi:hypothetical protein AVEN_96142-1 [Araneus ventricosus]|uniref:Uncharacterized protein n=1 Tax=Araneus ventricosus TaxID=182803 RepID=A0A4Y2HS17_ARAVE|nr:hypothetical protein AVEN_96142-1 [Araneus ventricosus]
MQVLHILHAYQKTGSPSLPWHPGHLHGNRCLSAEAGVLVAITDHCSTPPVGGTYYHWRRDPSPHYCTPRRSEIPLTYAAASHPRTRGASPGGYILHTYRVSQKVV